MKHFNTAGPCLRGTQVVFDRRDETAPLADLVRFAEDRTPSGRPVTLLRA